MAPAVREFIDIYGRARFEKPPAMPFAFENSCRRSAPRCVPAKPKSSRPQLVMRAISRPRVTLLSVKPQQTCKFPLMTKVGFISLGCPKNLVDSEVMMGILARGGYELTPRADQAEILVVNTCSFIEAAQKESVDAILEMAEHKKFGAAKKLIVAGCLVERYRAQILEQVPEVDAIVGTGEVERILEAVEGDLRMLPAAETPAFLYHDLTPRLVTTPRHAAYIKIAEGCDHPCTFCIIPQLRGKFRSRRFESVLREAENLSAAGAREITLIGQDTTSYGEDLGLRDGLAQLLGRLSQIDDILWIRFLYAYPNRVTQKLLDTLASHPRIARYLDMPLQHASRNVLARMKRGSHGEAFLKLLERARATIPGVSLRTSFIVGFPGETENDFAELCDFVRSRPPRLDGGLRVFRRGQRRQLSTGRQSRPGDHNRATQSAYDHSEKNLARQFAREKRNYRYRVGGRPLEGQSARLGSPSRRHGSGNRRENISHRHGSSRPSRRNRRRRTR